MSLVCWKKMEKFRNKEIHGSTAVYIYKEIMYKIIQMNFAMNFKEMHYITHKMLTNCVTFPEQLNISVLQFIHMKNEANPV